MKISLAIFNISFRQEFAYKVNFLMWRLRNILQFLVIFYLWDTVFENSQKNIFGYDRATIFTYVFGVLLLKSFVLSVRSSDVAGEIADGRLTNYLLKPVNYFKYWFVRDFAAKTLNIMFAVVEFSILYAIFKPTIYFPVNLANIFFFLVSLAIATVLYFLILLIFEMGPFWYPEQAWGLVFLLFIFVDFLGGGIFPLDILPSNIQTLVYLTPFPHLLFTPLQIFLGKINGVEVLQTILIASTWTIVLWFILRRLWFLGLKSYRSEGR